MLTQYRIVGRLGVGGMGIVFRAEDVSLSRPVALKFLSGRTLDDEQLRARFLREARVIAGLNHPNICTIHAVDEVADDEGQTLESGERLEPGTPFLVLELIEGCTVKTLLEARDRPALDEVLRIAIAVGEGLAAAHGKGLVHRDLKPENVMVTSDGHVKILDFGLAKPVSPTVGLDPDQVMTRAAAESANLTMRGMVIGTISYMSPEQAQGKELDSRSDVFSFGVMLHEMLSGKRPFDGETPAATMAKIIESAPVPLADSRSDLSPELIRIVERCLRKKPSERYHDVRDLVVALKDVRRAVSSGVASAASTAPSTGDTQPAKKRVAAISVVGLIGVVAFAAWWAGDHGGANDGGGDDATRADAAEPSETATPTPAVTPEFRQITFDGDALFPAISPDGRSVAYARMEPNNASPMVRLMVRDIDSGGVLEVARSTVVGTSSWSSDGAFLAFVSVTDDARPGLAIVSRLGGAVRFVTDGQCGAMSWAPDGTRVAVVTDPFSDRRRLLLVNVESFESEAVATDVVASWFRVAHVDWSPDGSRLALTVQRERGQPWSVQCISLETGEVSTLVERTAVLSTAQWSGDGAAVYFGLQSHEEAPAIWRAAFDGRALSGEPQVVLPNYRGIAGFDLDASGRRMVYAEMNASSNVYTMPLEPAGDAQELSLRQRTRGSTYRFRPQLSPDGKNVAFGKAQKGSGDAIFVTEVDGGDTRQLTFPGADRVDGQSVSHGGVTWSRDAKRIYYVAYRSGRSALWSVPLEGGKPTRHGDVDWERARMAQPAMLPDGRLVDRSVTEPKRLVVIDPETGVSEDLLDPRPGEQLWHVCAAAEADLVAFMRVSVPPNPTNDGVWLLDMSTGEERRLHDPGFVVVGFTQDARRLVMFHREGTHTIVSTLSIEDGVLTRLGRLPSFTETGVEMAMAPDGSGLVVNVMAGSIDVWLAEDWDPTLPPR